MHGVRWSTPTAERDRPRIAARTLWVRGTANLEPRGEAEASLKTDDRRHVQTPRRRKAIAGGRRTGSTADKGAKYGGGAPFAGPVLLCVGGQSGLVVEHVQHTRLERDACAPLSGRR